MQINEKFELHKFFKKKPKNFEQFKKMWYNDLSKPDIYENEQRLLEGANSILKYFDSEYQVSDIDYDEENDCLNWILKE